MADPKVDSMPIAVLGFGCRFPGGVTSGEEFWDFLTEKKSAHSGVPSDRYRADSFYHPDGDRYGTTNNRAGHFLVEDISLFDAPFFSISPAEAMAMDPMQRLMLEVSYEAFENSGVPMAKVSGSNTSCFIGCFTKDYEEMLRRDMELAPKYQSTGASQTMLSNRISYFFNMKGPSISLDTACSSGLIAVHLACQSLRTGESTMAIAGGSNLILSPDIQIEMSDMHFLSPDSISYAFDKRANGYARGEGIGAVILKPLELALRDKDPIRAVIRGTASSSDGRTPGITMPSTDAQVALIRSAYASAGCDVGQTGYFEAHGTGTAAGDPIETAAIAKVFSTHRLSTPGHEKDSLRIGSVKTNVGHLEGASGIAGLIKAVLSVEKGAIAPNIWFEQGNPAIQFEEWLLRVPTEVEQWPLQGVRRASVNSFGYGGTNAHLILDDAENFLKQYSINKDLTEIDSGPVVDSPSVSSRRSRIFKISANDERGLALIAKALADYLPSHRILDEHSFLDNLAYTLCERRSLLPYSAIITATDTLELADKLKRAIPNFRTQSSPVRVGFVFTGQGAQWWRMGRELLRYPLFQSALLESDAIIKKLGANWSLIAEFVKDEASSRVNEATFSQPICTALQIALVDLLFSWNVYPQSVVGHSSGEIAAAYAVGALSQESAIAVAYFRGLLSPKIKQSGMQGRMMAVGLSEYEAQAEINASKKELGQVVIACVNSPRSVTLSGDSDAVVTLQEGLQRKGVSAKMLQVDTAYHSHHMRMIAAEYLAALQEAGVAPLKATEQRTMFSSVTEDTIVCDALGADYWVSNLVGTVRFSQALRNLCLDNTQSTGSAASSVDVLLEVGPHALFKGPVNGVLEEAFNGASQIQYLSLLTREKPADVTALDTIGQLSSRGHPVDLHAVNFPLEGTKQPVVLTDLPRYPWNHTRSYWWESRLSRDYRFRQFPRTDILGAPVSDWNPMEPRFRNFLRLREQPWLRDHVVQGNILFPACGYISMAIEACRQMCSIAPSWLASQSSKGVSQYRLREVSISRALLIPETDDGVEVSFSMRLAASTPAALASAWHDFRVYSYTKEVGWVENCRGLVSVSSQPIADAVLAAECHCEWQEARTSTTISLNSKSFYERVDKIGLTYGPTFQGLEDVRIHNREGRASGALQVTNTRTASQKEFEHDRMLHPATLDNFLQLALAALGGANMAGLETPMVPTFIADISVSASIAAQTGDSLHVIATAQRNGAREANGDIFALDSTTSKPVVLVDGFKLIALDVSDSVSEVQAMPTYCFSAFWQPDVDLLGPYNLDRELRAAAQAGGCQGSVRQLELLSYYFIDQTLRQIGENEVNSMLPHHQRFYRNLRHLQEAVLRGAHPAQTAEWQCLDNPNVTIRMQGMIEHYRDHASAHDGKLLVRVGETLPSVLRQDVEPLALMTQGNLLESYYTTAVGMPRTYAQITRYIAMLSHKNPNLNYLEIGAGTGGATVPVLEGFTNPDGSQTQPRLQSYTYTDISSYFFERAAEKFADYTPFMDFKKLDVEHDPEAQGFEPGSCDVIVAANVLHATSDIHRTMTHVRKLLRPGGRLILLEMTNRLLAASVIFGTLPGWWNASEEWRTEGPLLTEAQWEETLRSTGFSGLQVSSPDVMDPLEEGTRLMIATAIEKTLNINNGMITPPENSQVVILCAESRTKMNCLEVPLRLRAKMEGAGFQTLLLPFSKATVEQLTAALCVSFVEFDEPMLTNPSEEEFKTIQRILEVSTRLLWVTRGAASSGSPRAELALSQGLGRTLNAENGRFSCLTIDLDNEHRLLAEEVANLLYSMVTAGYGGSDLHENADSELIERRGIFHIRRTIGDHTSNQLINARTSPDAVPPQLEPLQLQERALKLKARTSNKDGFIFENDQEHLEPLVPHEIEIEVRANSAQAKDVAFSDDVSAHHTWSRGCSGVVTRSGASTPFSVGDQVIALCTGALTTHVRISAAFAHRLPSSTTLEAGALLPLAYTTAYYCLVHLSRLEHGEYVLIHEATSPVGEAALQIATKLGAKVLMTTSNEDEKAHLLVKYGVSESAILPSLESNFVVDTRRMTEGRGVDVILNALRGEALQTSFSCMAPFGRFLELGTSNAQANERLEMSPLRRNVNFTSVDMEYLLTHKPALASEMFQSAMQFVVDHNLRISTPATTKTWSELTESVEILQGGSDLVLTCSGADRVLVAQRPLEQISLNPNGTYLLAGGLGGLGRSIASWLVQHGAKHLIFVSRSGACSTKASTFLATLHASFIHTSVIQCDISDPFALSDTLSQTLKTFPPLHGVIQAAMKLNDSIFNSMTHSQWMSTILPKVHGSKNLHEATLTEPLDFFILLSSLHGHIGNPGQANYAAGCAYQVALAKYRNTIGLPAVAIDLGIVEDVGYVVETQDAGKKITVQGFKPISEVEMLALIELGIREPMKGHIITGLDSDMHISQLTEERGVPFFARDPALSHLDWLRPHRATTGKQTTADSPTSKSVSLRSQLALASTNDAAQGLILTALLKKLSKSLMMEVADLDAARPLSTYGIDSLVAVELKGWVQREIEVKLSVFDIIQATSINALVDKIADRTW